MWTCTEVAGENHMQGTCTYVRQEYRLETEHELGDPVYQVCIVEVTKVDKSYMTRMKWKLEWNRLKKVQLETINLNEKSIHM